MTTLALNGCYKLTRIAHGESHAFVFRDDFVPEGWLDTFVPEDIRTVLRRAGYISGYYLGKDLDSERWIEESDWLYYRRFSAVPKEERVFLRFEGIDTLCEIELNGVRLGMCENMFMSHCFDISAYLNREGTNVLVVRILSPVKSIEAVSREGLYPQEDTGRLLLRKSQMNYGWDFCGHCLTGGLWKGVYLDGQENATLGDVYLRTETLEAGFAQLRLSVNAIGDSAHELQARVSFFDGERVVLTRELGTLPILEEPLTLENPKLWWPRPYGEAHLYEAKVELLSGGCCLDTHCFRFGVRTVTLIQEPLVQGGRSFVFEVNGRRLFMRGANWVPCNAVYGEITDAQVRYYLDHAEHANLSMLRVWGGGIYESDLFFDLCDEKGIMVMQDFMLACGILPQDDAFLEKVSTEVAFVVRKYRNRTSLVLWSADNELDQAYWWYGLEAIFKTNRVNRFAVRRAVEQLDPYRPFLVSSPCSPFEDEPGQEDPNSSLQGDMHVYLTRFSKDSPYYYRKLMEFVPRFMSEYGFSSLPSTDSYRKFNFFDKALDMQANPWLGELPAFEELRKSGDTQRLIYFTQFTHAQGLKYWIEYMRSYKGICGGSLYWKYNDPIAPNRENMLFPSMMSAIDFYGKPKLAYEYSRRAYEDVIIAFRETKEGGVRLVGCNETLQAYIGELRVDFRTYDGRCLPLYAHAAVIAADAAAELCVIETGEWRERADGYIKADFTGKIHLENRFFPKDIGAYVGLIPTRAQLACERASVREDVLSVTLHTDHYAQDVVLSILDVDVQFSDNGFCMDANTSVTLTAALNADMLRDRCLKISALNTEPIVLDLNLLATKEK